MKNAVILSSADVKKILAEYFKVDEKQVVQTKYSYVIEKEEIQEKKDERN